MNYVILLLFLTGSFAFAGPNDHMQFDIHSAHEKVSLVYPTKESASINSDQSFGISVKFLKKYTYRTFFDAEFHYNYSTLLAPQDATLADESIQSGSMIFALRRGRKLGMRIGVNTKLDHYFNINEGAIKGVPYLGAYGLLEAYLSGGYGKVNVNIKVFGGSLLNQPQILSYTDGISAFYWGVRSEIVLKRHKKWLSIYTEFKQHHLSFDLADQSRINFTVGLTYKFR